MNQTETTQERAQGGTSRLFCQGKVSACVAGFVLACLLLFPARPAKASGAGEGPLVFLGDKDYPPVAYLDGGPKGMDVDLAKALAAVMKREVRVELMDWNLAQEKVSRGEADGLLGMSVSEERRKLFDFCDPTLTREFVLVVRSGGMTIHGVSDLEGRRVGVTSGGFPRNFLSSEPGIEFIPITNYRDGLERLSAGTIDVMAADRWVAAYLIEKTGIRGVTILNKPFATAACAIAVRKGNAALVDEFNRAIRTLKAQGKIAEIQDSWRPQEIMFISRERVRNAIAVASGLFLAIVLTVMGIWIFTLRRQARERRDTEQELRWRTAFFEAQVNSAIDGILVVDSQGRKILQNQRMTDLLKIPPHLAADPDDTKQLQFVLGRIKTPQAFAEKVAYLYAHPDETSVDEIELIDGTILDRYSAPVRGPDGKHYGRVWTFHDITAKKQAEAELLNEKALSDAVFNSLPGVFFMFDQEGALLRWNDEFARNVGITAENAAVHRLLDCIIGEDKAMVSRVIECVYAEGSASVKARAVTTHGIRYFDFFARRLRIGQKTFLIGSGYDITERKVLEEQFLRAQRMESIGLLASGIAHDLNNVLCPILMSTQLLEELAEDPANKSLLVSMQKSARRGTAIIRQVLTFARGIEGERAPIQLRYLVKEIAEIASETFPRNISVSSSYTSDLQIVLGDSTQLHQVILNLCVNARDAMPKGGVLRLELDEIEVDETYAATAIGALRERYVRLSVIDTGEGIPQEIRDRIFDPFFTTKAQGKGTGLGLATALGIVQSHRGFITVQSQPGAGTTFRVHLPVCKEALASPQIEPALEDVRGHGEGILLADDEEELRTVASQVLERAGYRSYAVSDGAEALECLARHEGKIDLVVTDLMMPIMDGLFLIQAARRQYPKLPFVVASGLAECDSHAEQIAALKAMDVTEILVKPFSASGLLRAVNNVLGVVAR